MDLHHVFGKVLCGESRQVIAVRVNCSKGSKITHCYHSHRVSYPFLNKKFKDFQGHISHISRTLFNSKRALILCLFLVPPQNR